VLDIHMKTVNKQGEASSLSDESSSTRAASSPGRARKVSMKIKKGLKEVKEMLSPHHHHHHHHHGPDGECQPECDQRQQRRRKSGPNESRRGPLAPVLDHLAKNKSVPIHLHISRTGDFSVSRKGSSSSSSHSCSDIAHDESRTLADIHQHIQPEDSEPQPPPTTQAPPPPPPPPPAEPAQAPQQPASEQPLPTPTTMEVPEEPFVTPPSPQYSNDGEQTLDPFLVDDPEDPLSDPGSPDPAPVPHPHLLDPVSLPLEISPSESVALSPAPSELPLPPEPAPPAVDKPVPALPVNSSDTESETGATAVHLPQLVMPTMFLPIPNVRISSHLTWWLTRRTPIYY